MEFALVSVVLLPLVLGIIEYGMWFNDSLNVRQGVRESARAGVVQSFTYPGCGNADDMARLACQTNKQIGAVTGPTYVKVYAPNGWTKTKPLVVCAMVQMQTPGIVPLPGERMVRSRTQMSIEMADTVPTSLSYADAAPAGADWSWC